MDPSAAPPPIPQGVGFNVDATAAPQAAQAPAAAGPAPPPIPQGVGFQVEPDQTAAAAPPKPTGEAAKQGGNWRNFGAGIVEDVGEVGAMLDPFGPVARETVGQGVEKGPVAAAIKATPQTEKTLPQAAEKMAGLPNPENVSETTLPEYLSRAAGNAAGFPIPEGNLVTAAGRTAAQAVGQGVAQYGASKLPLPNAAKPVAQVVAGLAGGMAGAKTFDTALQNVVTTGAERGAVKAVQKASGMKPAEINAAVNAPTQTSFTGDQPTLAEKIQTPQMAVGQEQASAANPKPFMAQRAAQQEAMSRAVSAATPETPHGAADVSEHFQAARNAIDAAHTEALNQVSKTIGGPDVSGMEPGQAESVLQQHIDQQANAIGGEGGNDAMAQVQRGQQARGAIQQIASARKAHENSLWDAVRDSGLTQFDASGVGQTAKSLMAEVAPRPGEPETTMGLGSAEPVVNALSKWNGPVSLDTLRNQLSDIGERFRQAQSAGELQVARRLGILQDALNQTLENGITAKSAEQTEAVNAGKMSPEDTLAAKVANQPAAGATGPNPVDPIGKKPRKPQSLNDFVISKGGIQDQSGDLAAMGLDTVHHRMAGRLINKKGMTPDYMREAAVDAGYLPQGSDINDLYDALHKENVLQQPVYRAEDATDAAVYQQWQDEADRDAAARQEVQGDIQETAKEMGVDLSPAEEDHAISLAASGVHPEEAIRQATAATEEPELNRNAQVNAMGAPGVHPGATQGEMGVGPQPKISTPEEVEQARQAYAQARAATRTEKRITGPKTTVGGVLKKVAGEYVTPDSRVLSPFLQPGAAGFEATKNLVAHLGEEGAQSVLADQAAASLKAEGVGQNGKIAPFKWRQWMNKHEGTLSHFPELKEKFSSPAKAQESLDFANANRSQEMAAFDKSAAGKWLGTDPDKAARTLFEGGDRVQKLDALMKATAGNPAATEGLRKAVWDEFMRRVVSGYDPSSPPDEAAMRFKPLQTKKILSENKAMLSKILPASSMHTMEGIVDALERDAALKAKTQALVGSNTQMRQQLAKQAEGNTSLLSHALGAVTDTASVVAGEAVTGGLGGGYFAHRLVTGMRDFARALRDHNITTRNRLISEMYANPEFAKELFNKVNTGVSGGTIARAIKALGPVAANQQQARGGPIHHRFHNAA